MSLMCHHQLCAVCLSGFWGIIDIGKTHGHMWVLWPRGDKILIALGFPKEKALVKNSNEGRGDRVEYKYSGFNHPMSVDLLLVVNCLFWRNWSYWQKIKPHLHKFMDLFGRIYLVIMQSSLISILRGRHTDSFDHQCIHFFKCCSCMLLHRVFASFQHKFLSHAKKCYLTDLCGLDFNVPRANKL